MLHVHRGTKAHSKKLRERTGCSDNAWPARSNRQSYKDRVSAEHDYEINLKAELEIMLLHEKLGGLREKQWTELLNMQKERLAALKNLLESGRT